MQARRELAPLLAASAPMLHLTGALALPDAPLQAAFAGGVWLLARARGPGWALAGVPVGLALLSKYSAALLAPALLLLVLWDADLRRELRTRWPWLGAAVAVAIFAPTLLWDAAHGFASIGFQLNHGFRSGATLRSFGEFLAAQVGSAGPVVLLAGIPALVRARDSAWKRVAAATLVSFVVPIYSATRGEPEVNWTAQAFAPMAAAAGAWLAGRRAGATLVAASVALALATAAGFAAVQRADRFAGTSVYSRFHGWGAFGDEARRHAAELCREVGPPCDPASPYVLPTTYRLTPVAYYAGWKRLGGGIGRPSQLDLGGEVQREGEPVFLLAASDWALDRARERIGFTPLAPARTIRSTGPGGAVLHEAILVAYRCPAGTAGPECRAP